MAEAQETTLNKLIEALNAHDVKKFVELFDLDPRIEAKPLQEAFDGVDGITRYYEENFIGRKISAELLRASYDNPTEISAEVQLKSKSFENGDANRKFDILLSPDGKKLETITIDYKL
jgi:hypothetical protein